LVTIGTVADLMPLVGVNRSLVKHGLKALTETKRPGLLALYQEANMVGVDVGAYHVGYIVAPRLNAMGRLAHALDSLRLLLTHNPIRAQKLALTLGAINRDRQDLTQEHTNIALDIVGETAEEKILIVDHQTFHEGVIGLVAGKLAETYYRPSIVISRKAEVSKASARSVSGINIINLIRTHESHLVSVGGHPMAAGFSIKTENIDDFRQSLRALAQKEISEDQLTQSLTIDLELNDQDITMELYQALQTLRPFGIGNPKPVFAFKNLTVNEARTVGRDHQHLKLKVEGIDAIGFNLGHHLPDIIKTGKASLAASLDLNTFNGKTTLQLAIKDIN
jgi:single-stranded-DNA-specific exonuclease